MRKCERLALGDFRGGRVCPKKSIREVIRYDLILLDVIKGKAQDRVLLKGGIRVER